MIVAVHTGCYTLADHEVATNHSFTRFLRGPALKFGFPLSNNQVIEDVNSVLRMGTNALEIMPAMEMLTREVLPAFR